MIILGAKVAVKMARHRAVVAEGVREVSKALRGTGLVDALDEITSGDERRQAVGVQQLSRLALRVQLKAALTNADDSAVGVAELLFDEDVQAALAAVPHLGALAPLSQLPATRLDFVNLVLETLADFKEKFPGLGLGSSNITAGGKKYSGLEVAQAWAILTNYGHLFGTFESERGLLYHLDSEPALIEQLVRSVDPEGRESARRYLEERDLYHLYLALAALRVSGWEASPRRKAATSILALLPVASKESDTPLARALWAFRLARRISYHRMHGLLGIGVTFPPDKYKDILASVRAPIGAQAAATDTVTPLLGLLDRFHTETFFASEPAAALILTHLREFKVWWRQNDALPVGERVNRLFRRPEDWPKLASPGMNLVCRIRFRAAGVGWLGEVKEWLSRKDPAVWEGANFLLLPSHEDDSMTCDVFSERSTLPARTTWFVAGLLADRVTTSWAGPPAQAYSLWESVAKFGATLLRPAVRDGLQVTLSPVPANKEHLGWALACRNLEKLLTRLNDFCGLVADAGRKSELNALSVFLSQEARVATGDAVWVVFLCRVFLHDVATGKEEAEIDGLVLRVEPGRVAWLAVERKDGKRGTGTAQLEALGQCLRVPSGGPERGFSVSGNTTVLRFASPADELGVKSATPVRPPTTGSP
jgi:hypothetical protein